MFPLHVLKRKSRTKVGYWVYSSRYSWLCLIKHSADIRHWQLTWFSGNIFRIHSVHSKLKAFFDQLQMNECRREFLFWLNYCFWSIWSILDEFWKIMKIWLWPIGVHSSYGRQWGPHGCAVIFSFILIEWLGETNLILKAIPKRSVEGQASRSDACYLFTMVLDSVYNHGECSDTQVFLLVEKNIG